MRTSTDFNVTSVLSPHLGLKIEVRISWRPVYEMRSIA